MKNITKYISVTILILLSFYCTEKTATLVRNKDPLMQNIKEVANTMNVNATDAVIEDDYITPGRYGKRINEVKSLLNMKENETFNKLFLVTEEVKPSISIENNKDKIIKNGNAQKLSVSIIINNDKKIIDYLRNNKISASILIKNDEFSQSSYFEQINNDFNNYKTVEKLLNKNRINTNICIVDKKNYEICKKNKKYLVEPSLVLQKYNIVEIKSKVSSGSIIYVKESSIANIDVLIHYIQSKNLKIIPLSELINEH